MTTAATVAANVLVPPLLVAWVAFHRSGSRLEAVLVALTVGAYLVLVWRAGPVWSWFGSVWPMLFLGAYGAALVWMAAHAGPEPWLPGADVRQVARTVAVGLAAVSLLAQTAMLLGGRSHPEPAIELAFPLRDGAYHVVQGGSRPLLNHHYGIPAQRFALDIVALGPSGIRARRLMPRALEDYRIYGTPVHAPCDGEVIGVRGDLSDDLEPDPDPALAAGNHVSLACGDRTILLAHLKAGSPTVVRGERVTEGQVIGQAGSSGNVTEPHLHLHAASGRVLDHQVLITTANGLAMRFGGRFLIRNDVIRH